MTYADFFFWAMFFHWSSPEFKMVAIACLVGSFLVWFGSEIAPMGNESVNLPLRGYDE